MSCEPFVIFFKWAFSYKQQQHNTCNYDSKFGKKNIFFGNLLFIETVVVCIVS